MSDEDKRVKSKNDFKKIVVDLCKDLLNTFPEIKDNMHDDISKILNNDETGFTNVYNHCKQVFPERFFDILYQNVEIFSDDKINTCFLPGLEFKTLWNCDITDMTRETIWKYLQLILFSVVSDISEGESFGDTAKLFESINEDEFKSKLDDTINNIKNLFETNRENAGNGTDCSGINIEDLPDAGAFHDHINNMMEGKLGKLAREIAEETASELNLNPDDMTSANDYFQTLFKNPGKLMGLVKNVGDKLDTKLKSGDIKESELMEEASNIMKRMKDMPGMENIQSMLNKMGMPNLGGKNMKVNMGAVQNHLNQNLKMAKTKERLKRKIDGNEQSSNNTNANLTSEELEREATITRLLNEGNNKDIENLIFRSGEKMEKSVRPSQSNHSQSNHSQPNNTQSNNNPKKNKGKHKK